MLIGDHWAVEFERFSKRYAPGGAAAVTELSLKLAPGQVLGLLGPNGSGKSTTLKALAGLVAPTAGQCRVFGATAGSDEARARVGYLPESLRFSSHQSGREALRYCAELASFASDRLGDRVQAVLDWAGLAAVADQRVGTYSKGMRQRLGVAQAIVHEPRLVLLDEPASGLDPAGRVALARLVRELAGEGRAVVFSSHLLAQAEQVCDRIALLGAGRLLAFGSPVDLLGGDRPAAPEMSALEKLYQEKLYGQR